MGFREEKSDKIINTHVMMSMGAGAIPVPLLDVTVVTAIQLDMIREISIVYDADFSEDIVRNIISALAGSTLAKIGASLVKTIPVVGALLGGASMVILSGASTYAMGQVFVQHLRGGGMLSNFDFEFAKKKYQEEFEKGKAFAAKFAGRDKKEEPASNQQAPNQQTPKGGSSASGQDAFSKLELLSDLKQRGIITEEEFQAKKAQLLKDI